MAIIPSDEINNPKKPKKTTAKIGNNASRENLEAKKTTYDSSFETNIRPKNFASYIGQTHIKNTLNITIQAAQKKQETLDHILLYGSPGLGKTTLATVIANEAKCNIKITSAPALERPRDIIGILMSLKDGDILFIDEIHRLSKIAEEILYPAMEDFYIDMTTGKTQATKTLRVPMKKFTLIGATTKAGSLSNPLRDRFGIIHRLEFYSQEELIDLIQRTAGVLEMEISPDGAREIALRSRGTPRIANRFVKRVRDFAIVKEFNNINSDIAKEALDMLKIDPIGLDTTDISLLKLMIEKYNGGPVGLETMAVALGEDAITVEEVYEPYLIQAGIMQRTPRGRKVSPAGYKHLGYKMPSEQIGLGLKGFGDDK